MNTNRTNRPPTKDELMMAQIEAIPGLSDEQKDLLADFNGVSASLSGERDWNRRD